MGYIQDESKVVPGSFWKIKDEVSFEFIEEGITIEAYIKKTISNQSYNFLTKTWTTINYPIFSMDELYFLVSKKIEKTRYVAKFLSSSEVLEAKIPVGFWNNVFVLVEESKTTVTKPAKLFGKFSMEELSSLIKKNNSEPK